MKKIAIIGGGACGAAALIELLVQTTAGNLQDKVSFTLIERRQDTGYGLAFGSKQKSHLLNTQANLMGIYAEEPTHFAKWLKDNGGNYRTDVKTKSSENNAYTSRLLYGHYVSEQLNKTIKAAQAKKCKVAIINAEATAIERQQDEKLKITLSNGEQLVTDKILLALGTPKPNNFKKFRNNKQYIDFPWPTKRLIENTKKIDRVGILGTSLSAIDAVMTLVDNGHQGKITMFSPDGMLPRVQPEENKEVIRKHLTLSNLHRLKRKNGHPPTAKQLFRLFIKDVEYLAGKQFNWKEFNRYAKDQLSLLEYDIKKAEKGGDLLLNMAYALRHETSTIWSWMNIDQQILFGKWLARHWTINRHAIPLHNAKRLANLLREGKLEIVAENEQIEFSKDTNQFIITTSKGKQYTVNRLVNATGSAAELEGMDNLLIEDLLQKEYLTSHPIGGAVINPHTMQCISKKGGENIYAVGHLVNGTLLDVNAVWFNVKTIARLASEIIFNITPKKHV